MDIAHWIYSAVTSVKLQHKNRIYLTLRKKPMVSNRSEPNSRNVMNSYKVAVLPLVYHYVASRVVSRYKRNHRMAATTGSDMSPKKVICLLFKECL
jgi:hypothetical protein